MNELHGQWLGVPLYPGPTGFRRRRLDRCMPAMLALAERIFDYETRSALLDDVARVARPGRVTFAGDRYVPVLKYFFKLVFRIQFHD